MNSRMGRRRSILTVRWVEKRLTAAAIGPRSLECKVRRLLPFIDSSEIGSRRPPPGLMRSSTPRAEPFGMIDDPASVRRRFEIPMPVSLSTASTGR